MVMPEGRVTGPAAAWALWEPPRRPVREVARPPRAVVFRRSRRVLSM
jgi:hypothetical protein